MDNRIHHEVVKTTTEKLQAVLNDFDWASRNVSCELVKVQHVGGRDWVVIIRSGPLPYRLQGSISIPSGTTTTTNFRP